ncbi:hypothetical protein L6V77_02315 [Myxococcota bacterium]|nr:hypothetical protein [Myxococcota bacterium]
MSSGPGFVTGAVVVDALRGQAARTIAAVVCVAAVAAVAGLVDQRAPSITTLGRVALPSGALAGLGWTIASLRAERFEIALETLGLRPVPFIWLPAIALAMAVCMAAPARPAGAEGGPVILDVGPDRLFGRIGDRTVELVWDPETPPGPPLRRPTGSTSPPATAWLPAPLVWAAATLGLAAALTRRSAAPGLLATASLSAGATALGFALGG